MGVRQGSPQKQCLPKTRLPWNAEVQKRPPVSVRASRQHSWGRSAFYVRLSAGSNLWLRSYPVPGVLPVRQGSLLGHPEAREPLPAASPVASFPLGGDGTEVLLPTSMTGSQGPEKLTQAVAVRARQTSGALPSSEYQQQEWVSACAPEALCSACAVHTQGDL
ncbi:hypothetical protein NDU88_000184 [Pleurodeles waltl]|uniref:Uncharacterized protein n=1 Tax=Pleurodeles waltl TaxID=8319 RepID=A0AAV7R9A1_PLEWA|nr:hypothetical protein NDU88_000184 [Pleurodeles waltl]